VAVSLQGAELSEYQEARRREQEDARSAAVPEPVTPRGREQPSRCANAVDLRPCASSTDLCKMNAIELGSCSRESASLSLAHWVMHLPMVRILP
jgi:hypothetical protein